MGAHALRSGGRNFDPGVAGRVSDLDAAELLEEFRDVAGVTVVDALVFGVKSLVFRQCRLNPMPFRNRPPPFYLRHRVCRCEANLPFFVASRPSQFFTNEPLVPALEHGVNCRRFSGSFQLRSVLIPTDTQVIRVAFEYKADIAQHASIIPFLD